MDVIRVVILDDHPIVRAGLRAALETNDRILVVGEASTVEELMAVVERTEPHVGLIDLHLGQGDSGHDAIQRIATSAPSVRTVVVTAFDNEMDIRAALAEGAAGYVLKDAPEAELVAAVTAAAAGERPLAPQVASRLVFGGPANPDALTQRELEVLEAVARGDDNATVARELFISQATVKSHLNRVFTKLGVSTRTGAVAEARRRGLMR